MGPARTYTAKGLPRTGAPSSVTATFCTPTSTHRHRALHTPIVVQPGLKSKLYPNFSMTCNAHIQYGCVHSTECAVPSSTGNLPCAQTMQGVPGPWAQHCRVGRHLKRVPASASSTGTVAAAPVGLMSCTVTASCPLTARPASMSRACEFHS
jgi:hypothetical protein